MGDQRLVSTRFPYIPVTIAIGPWVASVDALLDTGFDGDLIHPRGLAGSIGVPDHYGEFILANGAEVYRPVFLGSVETGLLGIFEVEIAALGGEYMLGRGLSDRFSITLDHGRRIIVEP